MEFTKLLKYGTSVLFLILLAHGLILGFSIPTTILSVVLISICFAMEQKLLKHEKEEFNTKLSNILTTHDSEMKALVEKNKKDNEEVIKKIEATHQQINTMKAAQGMRKVL